MYSALIAAMPVRAPNGPNLARGKIDVFFTSAAVSGEEFCYKTSLPVFLYGPRSQFFMFYPGVEVAV
jgi:hypothetical protein